MTREQKQRILTEMYEALASWPESFDLTLLIHHTLGIISVMSEHERHTRIIAKTLMLITKTNYLSSPNISMREKLSHVEALLRPDLRGFASLFDLVIEENNLRVNTNDLLASLSFKHRRLAHIFLELIHNFDTYDRIKSICEIQSSKVLTVLFLRSLGEIFDVLEFPKEIISSWLISWRINKHIIIIINDQINIKNPGNLLDKERLILFLCLCSATHTVLNGDDVPRIEFALEHAGLPSLSFLVDWGIISIEDDTFVAKKLLVV